MLNLRAATWQTIGRSSSKDRDFDFELVVSWQPTLQIQGMLGSTNFSDGKPFRMLLGYIVVGAEMLNYGIKCDSKSQDFEFSEVFDLSAISLMTQPVFKTKPSMFGFSEKTAFLGESFFYRANSPAKNPHQSAFTLRYPETGSKHAWEEAVKFSRKLKDRILSLHQVSED